MGVASERLSATQSTTRNVCISLTIILTHLLFAYGQTQIMWIIGFTADVDLDLRAVSLQDRLAFELAGLENPTHVEASFYDEVANFTYWHAVDGLWEPGDPMNQGRKGCHRGWYECLKGRGTAALLVGFSGLWPHLKLLLMHYNWYAKRDAKRRSTTLYFLETFGKWSIADVFLICTMIACLNLHIPVDGRALVDRLDEQLGEAIENLEKTQVPALALEVCSYVVPSCLSNVDSTSCTNCVDSVVRFFDSDFDAALRVVNSFISTKSLDIRGGATGVLRVEGRHGIYVFCTGVLLSLALSAAISVVDHKFRGRKAADGSTATTALRSTSLKRLPERAAECDDQDIRAALIVPPYVIDDVLETESDDVAEDVERDDSRMVHLYRESSPTRYAIGSLAGVLLAIVGMFVVSFQRVVPGSIPEIISLELKSIHFERTYSIYHLVRLSGEAGGADYILMTVFGAFVLVGPLCRSLCAFALSVVPMRPKVQWRISRVMDALGAFCGWDVLCLSAFLVHLEMGPITETIVSPETPVCKSLAKLSPAFDDYCLEIQFDILINYACVVVGAAVISVAAVRLHAIALRAFRPYE